MKVYKVYGNGTFLGIVLSNGETLKNYITSDDYFKLEETPPDENNEVRIDLYEPFNIVVTKNDSLIGKRFHDGAHVFVVDSWNKEKGAFNVHLVGQPDLTALYGEKYIRKSLIQR